MPLSSLLLLATLQHSYTPEVSEASPDGRTAMASFETPEGFEVDLWAAEPMLANPVIFHVDHAGDLYVCESFRVHAGVTDMRSHMDWLEDELNNLTVEDRVDMYRRQEGEEGFKAYGTEHERIRLIRDTDGDGKADAATVFADGFNDPADGIAAGVLSYRGDVFYTCIPHLWRLRDDDGDGVADQRDALSSGYGVHVALLGHDMHGLVIGPDGRLYWSIGDRGYHVEHEGETFSLPHTGAVFRSELDGSNLEVVHTGLRNPQELAFDDRGDLFTGDNNSDGGDEARWVQIVEGADTGWRFYYQYVTSPVVRGPWNDELLWKPWHEGQPAYILPPIANLANGPSGLEYYPGTGLPEEYRGSFFLCDFRGDASYSGVHVYKNVEKGAGFELGEVEHFVWKTLVTDCQFGPDGAFYWTDWVHGWGMTGKGRVYRMTHPAANEAAALETAAILKAGVDGLDVERLTELLAHADKRVRQEAHLALARRGERRALALTAIEGDGLARLHGIWGLWALARWHPEQRDDAIETLMFLLPADPDVEVRAQAVRVLGDLRAKRAVDYVFYGLSDKSARVRAFAAIGLGRLQAAPAAKNLFRLASEVGETDPVLRHAAVMGLVGCASDAQLIDAAESEDRHVRMASLLALRRRAAAEVATYLDDSDPAIVREAATAIHDDLIESALPSLGDLITRTTEAGFRESALVRRALHANLMLGGAERARAVAAYALRDDQAAAHRAEAFDLLAEWHDPADIDRVLGRWLEQPPRDAGYVGAVLAAHADAIAAQPPAVTEAWIRAASTVRADVAPTLTALLRDAELASSTRVAALRGLEAMGAADLRVAVGEALTDGDGVLRAAGLDALGRLAPDDALPILGQVLERGELEERRVAYRTLGTLDHPDATAALARELDRMAADLVPAELALDLVLAAEAKAGELTARLSNLRSPREADPELAPWLDSLFGGDPARGRRIFREKSELSCLRCHQTQNDEAVRIGPNLAKLSDRMTRLGMMESIVAPNRGIAAGFESETFYFTDGDVVEGRVIEEAVDHVVVVDSQGEVWDIFFEDLDERRPALSAMPNNLTEHITREELRDLIAYLAEL